MKKRFLIITVAVIAVLAIITILVVNQGAIDGHMYPQDAINEDSNLLIQA